MADAKVYQLPKSGLKLSGGTISRHEGEALIADHALAELHEIVLRGGRDGGDVFMFLFFGSILAAAAYGFYAFAWKGDSALWGIATVLTGLVSLFILLAGLGSKTWWLVLKGSSGEIVYPVKDEIAIAEAFFAELRQQAQQAKLMTGFKIER